MVPAAALSRARPPARPDSSSSLECSAYSSSRASAGQYRSEPSTHESRRRSRLATAPLTQFTDLPHSVIRLIGMNLAKPNDVAAFLQCSRHVHYSGLLAERAPALIGLQLTRLWAMPLDKRLAAATRLALGLGKRLTPPYMAYIAGNFLLQREQPLQELERTRRYLAAALLDGAPDRVMNDALATMMGPPFASRTAARACLEGVAHAFARDEALMARCYAGLWNWYSADCDDESALADFAVDLLKLIALTGDTVRLAVLPPVLACERLATRWPERADLFTHLHWLATRMQAPAGSQSDALFIALEKAAVAGRDDKNLLLRHLDCFSPLLAPRPGEHRRAGIRWLVRTLQRARHGRLFASEIERAVSSSIFSATGRSYIVNSALQGKFSHRQLERIERN